MNFLRKIITVLVIIVAVLGGQGWSATRVELPGDPTLLGFAIIQADQKTPGHRGIVRSFDEHDDRNTPDDVRMIALAKESQEFIWIQVLGAPADTADIYFPVDGYQPTTQEAVAWSCANVADTGPGSPGRAVTDWYVEMFGGPRAGGAPTLQMGFAPLVRGAAAHAVQNPQEIITLKDSRRNQYDDMDGRQTSIDDPTLISRKLNREEAFWITFRQIAANPVGRVLLYRLLIEIRRVGSNNTGVQASNIQIMASNIIKILRKRNNLRNIVIEWNNRDSHSGNRIRFNTNSRYCPTILNINGNQAEIGMVWCDPTQRFFHELLHHFHQLQDKNRHDEEKTGIFVKDLLNPKFLSNYFWYGLQNASNNIHKIASILPWSSWRTPTFLLRSGLINLENLKIKLEELRTICGSPSAALYLQVTRNAPSFRIHNGDDLCENLFLRSLRRPLRFGHEKVPFIEDATVISRLISSLDESINNYCSPLPDVHFPPGKEAIRPEGASPLSGLGDFIITEEDCIKKLNKDFG